VYLPLKDNSSCIKFFCSLTYSLGGNYPCRRLRFLIVSGFWFLSDIKYYAKLPTRDRIRIWQLQINNLHKTAQIPVIWFDANLIYCRTVHRVVDTRSLATPWNVKLLWHWRRLLICRKYIIQLVVQQVHSELQQVEFELILEAPDRGSVLITSC